MWRAFCDLAINLILIGKLFVLCVIAILFINLLCAHAGMSWDIALVSGGQSLDCRTSNLPRVLERTGAS